MGIVSVLSFGSDKEIKRLKKLLPGVNNLKGELSGISDSELLERSQILRNRAQNGENLDNLMNEAFALVREATFRTLGFYQYDVQILGAMVLHSGNICEMGTGEGKTLVAPLAAYLNSLTGNGVHVITVNDYLADRDASQTKEIMSRLGVTVGSLNNNMNYRERQDMYSADITYGTNTDFGFDYLRDNIVKNKSYQVQRGHNYAIIDEIDSILIDEARTPLIISGKPTDSVDMYYKFANAVKGLKRDFDYVYDEAKHTIYATEDGLDKIEERLGIDDIYASSDVGLINMLIQALRAEYMFHKDDQYIVSDGQVKIVDEFTGRVMDGRQYSEGLHQAIEAKEGVKVNSEHQIDASITIQNYFRLYDKLSGMTGTAATESAEFGEIYHMDVQTIPPNKPSKREDLPDKVFLTDKAKNDALVKEISELNKAGIPVLVGTTSVEESEKLSEELRKNNINNNVLNAKNNRLEAAIIAQAGRSHAVTISTNMAGRGTDILLGGNYKLLAKNKIDIASAIRELTEDEKSEIYNKVKEECDKDRELVNSLGGLFVIGTSRSESRRIDNQLRGRAGRQGDPGKTQFYLSLDDKVIRLFAGDNVEKIRGYAKRHKFPESEPIETKLVTNTIDNAQRKIEEINFYQRKNVLEYDDVLDVQRSSIYKERNAILSGDNILERVDKMIDKTVDNIVESNISHKSKTIDTVNSSLSDVKNILGIDIHEIALNDNKSGKTVAAEDMTTEQIKYCISIIVKDIYHKKRVYCVPQVFDELSRNIILTEMDYDWKGYITQMSYLKTGISLRSFAQKDPLVEYKNDAYKAFGMLVDKIYQQSVMLIIRKRIIVSDNYGGHIDTAQFAENNMIRPLDQGLNVPKQFANEVITGE